MKIDESKALSKDLKIIGQTLSDSANAIVQVNDTIRSIKHLISEKSDRLRSKLIAAGVTCIAFPEPFFSDALGLTLIATGLIISKCRGPTIMDVFREARRVAADLRKLNKDLSTF